MSRLSAAASPWQRMAPFALVVVGLHAALLSTPVRSARVQEVKPYGSVMQVRTVAVGAAATVPMASPTVAESIQAMPEMPTSAREAPVVDRLSLTPVIASEFVPQATMPPQPLLALVVPGLDADDDYYPRSMLSQGPRPIESVLIDYPEVPGDQGRYRTELLLFIDERGQVARVRVDGDALPAALEAAARNAFLAARFHAGQLEGRPVKSRIRVEVVFDSRPIGASS